MSHLPTYIRSSRYKWENDPKNVNNKRRRSGEKKHQLINQTKWKSKKVNTINGFAMFVVLSSRKVNQNQYDQRKLQKVESESVMVHRAFKSKKNVKKRRNRKIYIEITITMLQILRRDIKNIVGTRKKNGRYVLLI